MFQVQILDSYSWQNIGNQRRSSCFSPQNGCCSEAHRRHPLSLLHRNRCRSTFDRLADMSTSHALPQLPGWPEDLVHPQVRRLSCCSETSFLCRDGLAWAPLSVASCPSQYVWNFGCQVLVEHHLFDVRRLCHLYHGIVSFFYISNLEWIFWLFSSSNVEIYDLGLWKICLFILKNVKMDSLEKNPVKEHAFLIATGLFLYVVLLVIILEWRRKCDYESLNLMVCKLVTSIWSMIALTNSEAGQCLTD